MIEIKSLIKTYQPNKKKEYRALNSIDLTLPDHGLVFLLGKSGSGKSTFLNVLGGLDSATSGSILVDGNELSGLRDVELAAYRGDHIGFVFQDYCLIDEFTVSENVATAFTVNGSFDAGKIQEALTVVGLEGYEDKYPSELSGGECQRVAIARAMVKNPRMILADEPTGNLDKDTTKAIFDLLREFSWEHLVFVVSHDEASALRYADRIIVLEKGRVISDERNPAKDGIRDVARRSCPERKKASSSRRQNVCYACKTGGLFLKSKLLRIGLCSFMVALIMVVMMLAQTIATFDSAEVMRASLEASRQDSVFLTKTLDKAQKSQIEKLNKVGNTFPEVKASDIQAFRDAGYQGDIYPVLKCNLSIKQSQVSAGMTTSVFEASPYILEPLGVMVVDEDFLTQRYGQLEYVAKAEQFHPTGMIITDYLADIMLKSNQLIDANDYDDLLGEYHWGSNSATQSILRGYVNGIINTGYKEKYSSVLSSAEKYGFDYVKETLDDEALLGLMDDIHSKYGFCYSLNPNFEKDALEDPSWDMVWHYALRFGDGDFFATDIPQVRKAAAYAIELEQNEVLMEMTAYNRAFGTQYTAETLRDFKPHTETLSHCLYSQITADGAQFTKSITIAGLFTGDQTGFEGTFLAGDEVYRCFAKSHFYTTGLYFDHMDQNDALADTAAELGFQHNLMIGESVRVTSKAVEIFIPIFHIIAVILYVAIVFILMNFALKTISDKMRQIGILKALGAKNRTVGAIFGVQIVLIAITTMILAVLGYSLFVDHANDLLIASLRLVSSDKIIPYLKLLTFKPEIALQNFILVLLLALVSYIVPILRIRSLDPVRIIRTKE